MDGVLYCKTHFEQLFKETGSFSKKFAPGNITPGRVIFQRYHTNDLFDVTN